MIMQTIAEKEDIELRKIVIELSAKLGWKEVKFKNFRRTSVIEYKGRICGGFYLHTVKGKRYIYFALQRKDGSSFGQFRMDKIKFSSIEGSQLKRPLSGKLLMKRLSFIVNFV